MDQLIEDALKDNPTIESAQAALRVAQEAARAQEGAWMPQVDVGLSLSRQKIGSALQSPLNSQATLFNLHTAQVSVSYVPDVFGLNRRLAESLNAQADAARFQLEATYQTLVANIVVAVIQEATLRDEVESARALVSLQIDQMHALETQFRLGDVAATVLLQQSAVISQSRQYLSALEKQLAQEHDLLSALCGKYPNQDLREHLHLSDFQLPQDLPLSLPSRLVGQRPDIQAAAAALHAASAEIGVAQADMLPQLTLSAGDGFTGPTLAHLLSASNAFWSVLGGVTQPLFHGGTLLHRKRGAEAAYDLAAQQYRSTVLVAFQGVADVLNAIRFDSEGLQAAAAAKQSAGNSVEAARAQERLGDISPAAVLVAEQIDEQAALSLYQAQANRLFDTVALFQALGGGWWNGAADRY